jgi:hypothetical protein
LLAFLGCEIALLSLAGVLSGCRGNSVEALSSALTLRTLPDCAPDSVARLVVEPLGDFAQQEQAAVAHELEQDHFSLTGLPAETEWFRLHIETSDPSYRAFALAPVGPPAESLDALLLPLTRTCSVRDEAFSNYESSARALVAGDDLLLAGGFDRDQAATRVAQLLRVATRELATDARGLDVPRAEATALALADETWVLGGSSERRTGALASDTFDRFDAATRSFAGLGRMRVPRVSPAALALLDGSALIAGGLRAFEGEPLASIESITADGTDVTLWSSDLPFAAQRLALLGRDNGRVVAIALSDTESLLANLDPDTQTVRIMDRPELSPGAIIPPELATALPGGRVGMVELDALSEKTTGSAYIMFAEDDSFLKIADPRETDELTWLASFAGVEHSRVLGLPDGRILLTGVRQDVPLVRLLDPARRDVATRSLDIVVDDLFLRADGSVLMIGEQGARILREDAQSPFDNPGGNLLADDSGALCLDAYGRFAREGLGLRATVFGARLDLVPLRYRDVRIELSVEGAAELVLTRADGAERSIQVGTESVGPAYCKLAVTPGQPLAIERHEERITLSFDEQTHSCQLDGMTGPIAIAVVARAVGTLVSDLRTTRL